MTYSFVLQLFSSPYCSFFFQFFIATLTPNFFKILNLSECHSENSIQHPLCGPIATFYFSLIFKQNSCENTLESCLFTGTLVRSRTLLLWFHQLDLVQTSSLSPLLSSLHILVNIFPYITEGVAVYRWFTGMNPWI